MECSPNFTKIFNGRLAKKIILVTVLISSIVALVMTAFQLYFYYLQDVSKIESDLSNIEKSYSRSLVDSIWILDSKQVLSQLKGITSLPSIISASVSIDGENEWQVKSENKKNKTNIKNNFHTIKLLKQYKNKKRQVGELMLEVSYEDIYSSLMEKFFIVLASNVLKTSLVSVFLLFAFHYLIVKHLLVITQYANSIDGEGESELLYLERNNKSPDEIDVLVVAINKMKSELQSSYSTIKEKSDNLEFKLKENSVITSKLQRSEKDLKNKESQLENIINNLREGLLILDDVFKVVRFNKAALDIFLYQEDGFKKRSFESFFTEVILSHSLFDESATLVFDSSHHKIMGVKNNNVLFPVSLSIVKINQDDRSYYICTFLDVSKQFEQEENIRRIQKMDALGKLTGGIAHDYNNMLGVILGFSELLKDKLKDKPSLEKYAMNIYSAGERGVSLTQKLLSFSRKKQSDACLVNINTLLKNQEDMLKKTLTARIKIDFQLEPNLWSVWLNSDELIDAVLNLSINAMHAMIMGGGLTVVTSNQSILNEDLNYLDLALGDYVLLSIIDTGVGMDEATRSKMFDPFFSTKGEQGTGLGLSQVYGFVNRSDGAVKVYSEQNHGTRITLYFPRNKASDEIKSNVATTLPKPNYRGSETILVVDDEVALAELAFNILTAHGYDVLISNDAKEALMILEKQRVDLLLSDIIMPNIDGYQLATKVKQKFPHTHILLCSGFADNRHAEIIDDLLYENILHKPYTSKVLLSSVRKMLDLVI